MKLINATIKQNIAATNNEAMTTSIFSLKNDPKNNTATTEQINNKQVVHKPIAQ